MRKPLTVTSAKVTSVDVEDNCFWSELKLEMVFDSSGEKAIHVSQNTLTVEYDMPIRLLKGFCNYFEIEHPVVPEQPQDLEINDN